MHKWISASCSLDAKQLRAASMSSSLSRILAEARPFGLSEEEGWAVLRQAGHAIQDQIMLVRETGQRRQASLPAGFTADTLLCESSGKIHFATGLAKEEQSERDFESTAVASLGRIVRASLRRDCVSERLLNLLDQMTAKEEFGSARITLLFVMQTMCEEWPRRRVGGGHDPASKVVAQLCNAALNRRPGSQSIIGGGGGGGGGGLGLRAARSAVNNAIDVGKTTTTFATLPHKAPQKGSSDGDVVRQISEPEIEFSRLDPVSPSPRQSTSSVESDGVEGGDDGKKSRRFQRSLSSVGIAGCGGSLHKRNDAPPKNLEAEDATEYENLCFTPKAHNLNKTKSRSAQLNGTTGGGTLMSGFATAIDFHHSRRRGRRPSPGDGAARAGRRLRRTQLNDLPPPHTILASADRPGESSSSSSSSIRSASSSTSQPFPVAAARSAVARRPPSGRVLYRVVRPLTAVAPTPAPATKRCVGPEFVVMASAARPVVLDLARPSSSAASTVVAEVTVMLLDGRTVLARVSPQRATAGEVLDRTLSEMDIKEAGNFCLAAAGEEHSASAAVEFWPIANDCKLSKVSPVGWASGAARERSSFTLFLRFRFLPNCVDQDLRDPNNKHQLYLQLRRDLLQGVSRAGVDSLQRLAGMALHTEFGDFAEDVHGDDGRYFLPEHYLPSPAMAALGGEEAARRSCVNAHRSMRGQSQTAAELAFCREARAALTDYGCHPFLVRATKRGGHAGLGRRHLGIHGGGIALFATGHGSEPHRLVASHAWTDITRIQYDKCRFQLTVQSGGKGEAAKTSSKMKFSVSEVKAKVMFDLAAAHHQRYLQQKWNSSVKKPVRESPQFSSSDDDGRKRRKLHAGEGGVKQPDCAPVEYCNPREKSATIKNIRDKILAKDKLSHGKLYLRQPLRSGGSPRHTSSLSGLCRRRRLSMGSTQPSKRTNSHAGTTMPSDLLVQRLTRYSSMASTQPQSQDLDSSDKENEAPASLPYRYKVYLEPEEDQTERIPVMSREQERVFPLPAKPTEQDSGSPPPPPRLPRKPKTLSSLQACRRQSENCSTASTAPAPVAATPKMRMGTRTSISALHRERLRSNHGGSIPGQGTLASLRLPIPVSSARPLLKKRSLDLDFHAMEEKSVWAAATAEATATAGHEGREGTGGRSTGDDEGTGGASYVNESLSDSLVGRFDALESVKAPEEGGGEEGESALESERRIVPVSVAKDASTGMLGLRLAGSGAGGGGGGGVYVEGGVETREFQRRVLSGRLRVGDRLVAVDGRSLEDVDYHGTIHILRRAGNVVQLLVSQIVQQ